MSFNPIRGIQIVFFIALLALGGWLRTPTFSRLMPSTCEVQDVWTATLCAETLPAEGDMTAFAGNRSLFHYLSAGCAAFVGEGNAGHSMRCYRLFPYLCGLACVGLIPLLGLRRRSGVFETADGPLWAMACVAVSPILLYHSLYFSAESFALMLFFGLLITARAYAQWPGYLPTIGFGALTALLLGLDGDVLWLLAVLIPSVIVGVGWTRLCLYWRTLHVVAAVGTALLLTTGFVLLGFWSVPSLPTLPASMALLGEQVLWLVGWLCTGGLGLIAWGILAVYGGFRPERRWTRLMVIMFPSCFMGAVFFRDGSIFTLTLIALTPVMAGMSVSLIPSRWIRGLMGTLLVAVLLSQNAITFINPEREPDTRPVPRDVSVALRDAKEITRLQPCRLRFLSSHTTECAQLAWGLRATVKQVTIDTRPLFTDADILLIREDYLGAVPKSIEKALRPGKIVLDSGATYHLFAQQPLSER